MFLDKKTKSEKNKTNRGFSLVEILIGSGIICLSLILIINLETGVSRLGKGSVSRVQAEMLAEEGVSAIENLRNSSWKDNIDSLSNNVAYRLIWNQYTNSWEATTSLDLIDGKFDRTMTLSSVDRDSNFNIVKDGDGTVDLGTRHVIVNVSWQDNSSTSTRSLSTYIHNIYNN